MKIQISEKHQNWLFLLGRIFVGSILFFSGFVKLAQAVEYFEIIIRFYSIVPDFLVPYVARTAPWIELILGAYLILGYRITFSSTSAAILMALFQVILAQALFRGLPIDECGCFGGRFIRLSLYQTFVLDTFCTLFLIKLAFSKNRFFSLDRYFLKN